MNCQRVRLTMYLVSDDEAEPDVLDHFRHHLEVCPACREQYQRVTRLLSTVRERCCRYEAPITLRQRIVARIRRVEIADG